MAAASTTVVPIATRTATAAGCSAVAMVAIAGPSSLPTVLSVPPTAAGALLGGSGRAKMVWEVLRDGDQAR